jgi:hypothetical protein
VKTPAKVPIVPLGTGDLSVFSALTSIFQHSIVRNYSPFKQVFANESIEKNTINE